MYVQYAYTHQTVQTYLEESNVILPQLVVMFNLHGDGFVRVHVAEFNVSCVGHVEGTEKSSWAESCARPHTHHGVKTRATGDAAP